MSRRTATAGGDRYPKNNVEVSLFSITNFYLGSICKRGTINELDQEFVSTGWSHHGRSNTTKSPSMHSLIHNLFFHIESVPIQVESVGNDYRHESQRQ